MSLKAVIASAMVLYTWTCTRALISTVPKKEQVIFAPS